MNTPDNLFRPEPRTPEIDLLIELYGKYGVPLDSLPYTEEFESLFSEYILKVGIDDNLASRHQVLHSLLGLRKSGRLPRLGEQLKKTSEEPDF